MKSEVGTTVRVERDVYQAPEIVAIGQAIELTQGMGGDSSDTGGWTIPVRPTEEE